MPLVGRRRLLVLGIIAFEVIVGLFAIYQLYAFQSFSWRHLLHPLATVKYTPVGPSSEATGTLPADSAGVPDVVTLAVSDATSSLRRAGFKLGRVSRVYLDGLTPGTVYQQSPASGSAAHKGSAVSIVVCAGTLTVSIPDVSGQALSQARRTLASAGLVLGHVTSVNDSAVNAGFVVSVATKVGAARRGGAVDLVVSKGPAPVPMPRLTGLALGDASVAAARLDLHAALLPAGARAGIVYRQSPSAGSAVTPGSSVRAWVDQGPSASFASRITSMDSHFADYNNSLGAHITCSSTSSDDRGIASYRWVATGLEGSIERTGRELSFVLPGFRPYGSMMVVLTVTDSSGQTNVYRHSIRVNWSAGTLR